MYRKLVFRQLPIVGSWKDTSTTEIKWQCHCSLAATMSSKTLRTPPKNTDKRRTLTNRTACTPVNHFSTESWSQFAGNSDNECNFVAQYDSVLQQVLHTYTDLRLILITAEAFCVSLVLSVQYIKPQTIYILVCDWTQVDVDATEFRFVSIDFSLQLWTRSQGKIETKTETNKTTICAFSRLQRREVRMHLRVGCQLLSSRSLNKKHKHIIFHTKHTNRKNIGNRSRAH